MLSLKMKKDVLFNDALRKMFIRKFKNLKVLKSEITEIPHMVKLPIRFTSIDCSFRGEYVGVRNSLHVIT